MRILFVNRMLGIAWGGGENFDYNLARALADQGHEVSFLGGRRRGEAGRRLDLETEWIETPYWRHWMYRLGGRIQLLPGAIAEADLRMFQRAAFEKVCEWKRRRGVDLVQVLGLPELARWVADRGWPVAVRLPGPPAWFQRRRFGELARRSGVGVFSHGDTVRFLRQGWEVPVNEVRPGIRGDLFRPLAPAERRREREAFGWDDQEFLLATVGRLVPGKGQEFLIRALARLQQETPGVRLAIAGDGPLRGQLEGVARQVGVSGRVTFLGQVDTSAVARLLGVSDVFSLCSAYENYSNAVLEAMSAGLPIVAPRLGGFPMQIDHGSNGFLFEPGDEGAFRAHCLTLYRDEALRARMSERAIQFASRFSWRQSAEEVTGLYERLLRR
ncbi:MAG: glycosyltransferase family 4 protein [Bryobacteraceae bacterium]